MEDKDKRLEHLKEKLQEIQKQIEEVAGLEGKKGAARELFSWSAPSRVFVRRDRKWFTNITLLVLILLLILLFIRQFLLMGVVLAVAFVSYVLATVPPEEIDYKITTAGLNVGTHTFFWKDLEDFWFSEKDNFVLLHINTKVRFPARLILIITDKDKQKIKEILSPHITSSEVPKVSWMDTLAANLSRYFPTKVS
ncbi:hypothetical protein HYW39_02880 [Candidatus Curtissbacteria bacterium]|nr:hypothetical protein [Candidatus Curtissbacteria bacterium]